MRLITPFLFLLFFYSMIHAKEQDLTADKMAVEHYLLPSVKMVKINKGEKDGLFSGANLYSYRRLSADDETKIYTGFLKVVQIFKDSSVAEIITEETDLSRKALAHPGIMAGDFLELMPTEIVNTEQLVPDIVISYFDLFSDPKASPVSFELSEEGKVLLAEQAKVFNGKAFTKLFVKAYTDHKGLVNDNQIESLGRASVVRSYLINELGFAPERVIAVGFGEQDQVDSTRTYGYERRNRRIVLEAL